jgi:membrane protease YdiL (CAAX protease family)
MRLLSRTTPSTNNPPGLGKESAGNGSGAAQANGSVSDLAAAATALVVGAAVSAFLFIENPYLGSFETYRLVNCALLLFVPLLTITLILRESPADFGLAGGDRRQGWGWVGIAWIGMLPLLVYTASRPEFRIYYGRSLAQPLAFGAPYAFSQIMTPHLYPAGLAYYEIMTGFYLFCWEFFFRGFLLFGLARAKFLGPVGAIIVQAIPFALLHWSLVPWASKPPLEIASAVVGGLALGALAWRTRSFLYGFLIHWAISATLDFLLILQIVAHRQ